jgi:hypothetical protein
MQGTQRIGDTTLCFVHHSQNLIMQVGYRLKQHDLLMASLIRLGRTPVI